MTVADKNVTALDKYPCAACGAQAEWNPAKQLLVCPFCGTAAPFEVDQATGALVENDLSKALRELPDEQRGWQAAKRSVQCRSCKAISVFDAERVGQTCDFCGSPALVDYHEIKSPIRPQCLLPFKVSEAQVREQMGRWYAGKWLAPGSLKSRAMVDRVRGVYIPYWTFDAQAVCPWQADAGHYHYTTETYRDSKGHTQTRQVRQVRWMPASGVVRHFFDDEPVPATHGISQVLLKQVEPFPTPDMVPYDTAFLSGFVVEHYQIALVQAAQRSQASMTEQLRGMCAAAVPGDTHRNLRIAPAFSGRTFRHMLVPVWVLTYTYGSKPYQVVVNGFTGRLAGQYPLSKWKIALLVLVALVVLLVILLASNS